MGEVFAGRYELVDLLGEGGMGSVWRAWDHRESCYVAAKVLRQSDAASLLRFVREQTYRIAHRHVVAPRGWAGEDDRVLFTMELVRGGSLATLLGDYGPLPAQWVAVLIDQVLAGLSAVHAAGLVHRDVKPGNVLLEPTGRGQPVAKLTDFGVAVAVAEPRLTRTSQLVGTPGYLAPEVVRGADPEPRHDLYAVGVLMAELLCGARPDPLAVAEPGAPDGVSAQLWSYARRLAAPVPGERPDSCEQARAELAELGVLPPPGALPDDEGADIEVLDVVDPLPPGWGADGPDRAPARPGPAARQTPTPMVGENFADDPIVRPDRVPDESAPPVPPVADEGMAAGPAASRIVGRDGGRDGGLARPGPAAPPPMPMGDASFADDPIVRPNRVPDESAPPVPPMADEGMAAGPAASRIVGRDGRSARPGPAARQTPTPMVGESFADDPIVRPERAPNRVGPAVPPGPRPGESVAVKPAAGPGGESGVLADRDRLAVGDHAPGHRLDFAGSRAGHPPPTSRAGRRRRWALVVASFGLIAAGLGLGGWVLTNESLWSGTAGDTTPAPSSNRPTSPRPGDHLSTPAPNAPCDFTEAGQRTTTPQGVVVCRRQSDGSYTWQR